jgi:protein-tyrosine phosphatase
VICTGNINRSPMGEVLLRERLAARGVEARVASVGTRATLGPAAPEVVGLVAELGLDLSGHRSRQLVPEHLAGTDLVLGMAREHVREAVVLDPTIRSRAFTLKELVRRGGGVGPRRADEPLDTWLVRADEGRTLQDLLGTSDHDDVADPIGRRLPAFRQALDEIVELSDALVRLVAPRSGGAR